MRIAVHVTIMVVWRSRRGTVHLAMLMVAMIPTVQMRPIRIAVYVAVMMTVPVVAIDVLGLGG